MSKLLLIIGCAAGLWCGACSNDVRDEMGAPGCSDTSCAEGSPLAPGSMLGDQPLGGSGAPPAQGDGTPGTIDPMGAPNMGQDGMPPAQNDPNMNDDPAMPPMDVVVPVPEGTVFPGAEWEVREPGALGFDAAKLDAATQEIFSALPGRQCVAVFRRGYLIHEAYKSGDKDTLNMAFSASKSFGSTLVGMAATQNLLKVDDLLSDHVKHDLDPGVTLKHLLTMTANSTPPGTKFDYLAGTSVLDQLARAVSAAAGVPILEFFNTNLRDPLGMKTMNWGNGYVSFGGNVNTNCRDAGRLGHLWVNNGVWDGKQLVSADYVRDATAASAGNQYYGYNFWLSVSARTPAGLLRGFSANGFNGQFIFIVPDAGVVISTFGSDAGADSTGSGTIIKAIFGAMTE